jgi:hypothetical protein
MLRFAANCVKSGWSVPVEEAAELNGLLKNLLVSYGEGGGGGSDGNPGNIKDFGDLLLLVLVLTEEELALKVDLAFFTFFVVSLFGEYFGET